MNLVIDASVIIAVVMNEPRKPAFVNLAKGVNLLAPSSVHWEIGNAFSAMFKRKRITLSEARKAIEAYYQIPVRFIEVDLLQAIQIVDQCGIYAYDAYIIASAHNQKCPLVTLDAGLVDVAKQAGITVLKVQA